MASRRHLSFFLRAAMLGIAALGISLPDSSAWAQQSANVWVPGMDQAKIHNPDLPQYQSFTPNGFGQSTAALQAAASAPVVTNVAHHWHGGYYPHHHHHNRYYGGWGGGHGGGYYGGGYYGGGYYGGGMYGGGYYGGWPAYGVAGAPWLYSTPYSVGAFWSGNGLVSNSYVGPIIMNDGWNGAIPPANFVNLPQAPAAVAPRAAALPRPRAAARPAVAPARSPARHDAAVRLLAEGDAEFGAQRYREALKRYQAAARMAPQEAEPLIRQSQAYVAIARFGDAAVAVRRALDVEPDWPSRGERLDVLYADNALARDAHRQSLLNAADRRPAEPDLQVLLGLSYFGAAQPQKAAGYFEAAAELDDRWRQQLDPFFTEIRVAALRREGPHQDAAADGENAQEAAVAGFGAAADEAAIGRGMPADPAAVPKAPPARIRPVQPAPANRLPAIPPGAVDL